MSSVRIITGRYRGRRLEVPPLPGLRPTTDTAREGLFNRLAACLDWPQVRGLDVFAGTGALGLELLSRGAAHLVSVESNRTLVQHLQQVRLKWPVPDWDIVQADAARWLDAATLEADLILMDPPYNRPDKAALVERAFQRSLLAPAGLLVLEHAAHETFAAQPHFIDQKQYGLVAFSFFSRIDYFA